MNTSSSQKHFRIIDDVYAYSKDPNDKKVIFNGMTVSSDFMLFLFNLYTENGNIAPSPQSVCKETYISVITLCGKFQSGVSMTDQPQFRSWGTSNNTEKTSESESGDNTSKFNNPDMEKVLASVKLHLNTIKPSLRHTYVKKLFEGGEESAMKIITAHKYGQLTILK